MDPHAQKPRSRGRVTLLLLGAATIAATGVGLVISISPRVHGTTADRSAAPAPLGIPADDHLASRAATTPPSAATSAAEADAPFEGPEESGDESLDTVRWSEAVTIAVRADDDGSPVVGAAVRALVSWKPEDFRAGVTDTAGHVRIPIPNLGTVIWARAPDFVVRALELEDRYGAPEAAYEVRLIRGSPLSGRVIRADDDAPVPGAEVYVWDSVSHESVECAPERYGSMREGGFVTDAEGRFALAGVPPGAPLTIAARAEGLGLSIVRLPADRAGGDVVLRLGDGGILEGTVTLDSKGPAAGVQVFAVTAGDDSRLRHPDARWFAGGDVRLSAFTRTDDAGHYRITGLRLPARYVAVAVGESYAKGASEPVTPSKAGARAVRDISLVTPAWLKVVTVAPDGSPVPVDDCDLATRSGAPVEDPFFSGGASYLGGSNEYSMQTRPPGRWLLLVRCQGPWRPARVPIELLPGEHKTVTVTLEPGFSIEGIVTDGSGRPLARAEVSCGARTTRRATQTDVEGRFRLEGLSATETTLDVKEPSGFLEPAVVRTPCPSPNPLRIVLAQRPTVVGRLVPPPGVSEVGGRIRTAGWVRSIWPDVAADGSFRLPHVPIGEPFDLVLWSYDGGVPYIRRSLRAEVGTTLDLGVVPFSPGRSVDGLVVDEHGAPLASAVVEPDETVRAPACRTDTRGRFHLDAAPEGPFSVVVRAPGRPAVFATVDGTGSPMIACPPGILVRGRLTGPVEDALADRRLRFVPDAEDQPDAPPRFFDTDTDSLGSFEVPLPVGSYEVFTISFGMENPWDRARETPDRLDAHVGHADVDGHTEGEVKLRLPGS